MSYRNPKVYAPDPTAFAKSFMGSFQSTVDNFEAEKEKKRQQQEKDDLIEAELVKYQNIGDLEGVSEEVNTALQDSINNLVDSKAFVNMSAVDRQRVLNDIQNIKAGSSSFVELMNISPDELSNKSVSAHPELHAILSQMKLDPSKVKITGGTDGADVLFTYTDENGNTNSTSLRDMRKYKNTYVTATEDIKFYNTSLDATVEGIQKKIDKDATNGEATRDKIVNFMLKNEDGSYKDTLSKDEKSTIFYEMIRNDADLRKQIGFELYPKGSSPEFKAAQDKAIYDYFFEDVNERISQPAVKKPVVNNNELLFDKQQRAIRERNAAARNAMMNINLTTNNPKMPKRPLDQVLGDFNNKILNRGYRIVPALDADNKVIKGKYDVERLEKVSATGIKLGKDLTDISKEIRQLELGNLQPLVDRLMPLTYQENPGSYMSASGNQYNLSN